MVNKKLTLMFFGTSKHVVDGICPAIANRIANRFKGITVYKLDKRGIKWASNYIQNAPQDEQIILIDIALLNTTKPYKYCKDGIYPAKGLDKNQNIKLNAEAFLININGVYPGVYSTQLKNFKKNMNTKEIRTKALERAVEGFEFISNVILAWRSQNTMDIK